MNTEIEEKYLFNFSEQEKEAFKIEQKGTKQRRELYRQYIHEAIKEHLPTYIADTPRPFSALEVKYQINRLALNDPMLTGLSFDNTDGIAGNDDARRIAKALETNTNCRTLEFIQCGFTDTGMNLILSALQNHPLAYLGLSGNPISMRTFQRIHKMTQDPKNKWASVDLGSIAISNALAKELKRNNPKISFKRIGFTLPTIGLPFFSSRDS